MDWTTDLADAGAIAGIVAAAVAIVALVVQMIDRIRSRPRFGVDPRLYSDNEVWVQVVQKGQRPAQVVAVKVVSVKSRLYRLFRKFHHDDVSTGLLILDLPSLSGAATTSAPAAAAGQLPEQWLLPPPRNPFGSFTERAWKRSELRLEVTVAGQGQEYMRIRRHKGIRVKGP